LILEKSKESTYNTIRLRIEKLIGSDPIISLGENPNSMCLCIEDYVSFLMWFIKYIN